MALQDYDLDAILQEGRRLRGESLERQGLAPVEQKTKTFVTAFEERSFWEFLPFFGSLISAREAVDLYEAATAYEEGRETRKQMDLIYDFLNDQGQDQTFGYKVGSILAELPAFAGEFALTKGAATAAVGRMRQAVGLGLQQGLKQAIQSKSKAEIAGWLGNQIGEAAAQAVVMEAVPTALGLIAGDEHPGGRAVASTYMRALPEMQLTEDEAGNLHIALLSSSKSFLEALPQGIADMFFETLSERMGGAMMKLPLLRRIEAAQMVVAKEFGKRFPGEGFKGFARKLAEKTQWHGPVGEFLEERLGGALRAATPGMEEFGSLEEVFPGIEQMAAELLAFSVPTAGAATIQASMGRAAPEIAEVPTGEVGEAAPVDFEMAVEQGLAALEKKNKLSAGSLERVPVEDIEASDARMFLASELEAGRNLVPFRRKVEEGEEAAELDFPAASVAEGVYLVDVDAVQGLVEAGLHESIHDIARALPERYEELSSFLEQNAPDLLEGAEAAYKATAGARLEAQGLSQEAIEAQLGLLNVREEAVAELAAMLKPLILIGRTERGAQVLEQMAREDRGLFEWVVDLVKKAVNAVLGTDLKTRLQKDLERLAGPAGRGLPERQIVDASRAISTVLGSTVGRLAPSRFQGPRQRAVPEAPQEAPEAPPAEEVAEAAPEAERAAEAEPEPALPEPAELEPEVRQKLTPKQRRRVRKRWGRLEKQRRAAEEAGEVERAEELRRQQAFLEQVRRPRAAEERRVEPTRAEAAVEAFEAGEEERFAVAPPVDTPAFKRWFGDSKVVDENGEPLVVYHGTKADITEFRRSRGGEFGSGIYFSADPDTASMFASFQPGEAGERLIPAYLSLQNPLVTSDRDVPRGAGVRALQAQGYDGVIGTTPSGQVQFVAFSPTQIKSATGNVGTFDPANPDIRFAAAWHGSGADFDRFDMEKVGTGEGAQAYGWGLYFADKKSVAEHYKKALSIGRRGKLTYDGAEPPPQFYTLEGLEPKELQWWWEAIHKVEEKGKEGAAEDALRGLEWARRINNAPAQEMHRRISEFIPEIDPDKIKRGPTGRLYRVDLAPADDEWLLWDQPLSEQSEKVKEGLRKVLPDVFGEIDVEGVLADNMHTGEHIYRAATDTSGSQEAASLALLEAGIRGIKYEDYARGTERADFNYVLFSDKDVEIEEKFAVAPLHRIFESTPLEEETRFDAMRRIFQDKHLPWLRWEEEIVRRGADIPEEKSVYKGAEAFDSKVEKQVLDLREEIVRPLLDKVVELREALDITPREVMDLLNGEESYLIARGAKAANKTILDRGGPENGSGMSDKDAADILKRTEGGKHGALYKEIGQLFDRVTQFERDRLVQGDIITEETARGWEKAFPKYAPLKTVVPDGMPFARGRGFSLPSEITKRRGGRQSMADFPLEHAVLQAQRAIVLSEKNEVGQRFLTLLREYPDITQWSWEKEERGEEQEGPRPLKRGLADNQFRVWENGEAWIVEIANQRLARSMMNLGVANVPPMLRPLMRLNRFLSAVNTSLDPEFILGNFARDLSTAGINLAGEEQASFAREVMNPKGLALAIRGVYRVLSGSEETDEYTESFRELWKAGGKTGWYYEPGIEEEHKKLEGYVRDAMPGAWTQAKAVFRKSLEFIDNLNSAVENAVRLRSYMVARSRGQSIAKAASLAKNLTVNFNRKGELGPVMNSLYLFYNASIQGTARMMLALKHPQVRKIAYGVATASALLAWLNIQVAGDDDDGENRYTKIPDHIKARNLIFMWPDGSGRYFKIPLPYGYNLFHAVGSTAAEIAAGERGVSSALAHVASTGFESFSPIGSEASFLQTISPTVTDPFLQTATNTTFYGAPIMPEEKGYGVPPPMSQRFFSTVSEPAKHVAQWLNRVTGGDEVKGGMVDVSPEIFDHFYDFVAGGLGRGARRLSVLGTAAVTDRDIAVKDTPFLRRVMGEPQPWYVNRKFYENRSQLETLEKQIDVAIDKGDRARASLLRRSGAPLLRLLPRMKSVDKQIKALKKRRQALTGEKADIIRDRIDKLQRDFNRLYQMASEE